MNALDKNTRSNTFNHWYEYRLLYVLGTPIFLAFIYSTFIASDYFVSESTFTIQAPEGGSPTISFDSILGGGGSVFGSDKDAYAVQHYLLSRDVLERLDREKAFRDHYESNLADWFSRLPENATFEELFIYYGNRVEVSYDSQTGVTTLKVKALTPEKAQEFNQALVNYGEEMVNQLSERARYDQILFARKELEAAEKRLTKARQAILAYQKQGEDLNPSESATAVMGIRNQLEAQLSKAKAELGEISAFMQPDSHRIVALKHKIESLQNQIEMENKRLVASEEGRSLSASIARFEPLLIEKEFAEKSYESALASLELARVEASKQHRYLATVAVPSLPDEAEYPKRLLNIFTVSLLTLFFYGIGALVVTAIKEHARV